MSDTIHENFLIDPIGLNFEGRNGTRNGNTQGPRRDYTTIELYGEINRLRRLKPHHELELEMTKLKEENRYLRTLIKKNSEIKAPLRPLQALPKMYTESAGSRRKKNRRPKVRK